MYSREGFTGPSGEYRPSNLREEMQRKVKRIVAGEIIFPLDLTLKKDSGLLE